MWMALGMSERWQRPATRGINFPLGYFSKPQMNASIEEEGEKMPIWGEIESLLYWIVPYDS